MNVPLVAAKVAGLAEGNAAATRVGPLPVVRPLVSPCRGSITEGLGAVLTLVGRLPGVLAQVSAKAGRVREDLVADLAGELGDAASPRPVNCAKMEVERRPLCELFAALRTLLQQPAASCCTPLAGDTSTHGRGRHWRCRGRIAGLRSVW